MFNKILSLLVGQKIPEQSLLCQHTTIGDRKFNEDAHGQTQVKFSNKTGNFLIVCDGMGGHVAGDITSQALVDCFIDQITELKAPLTADRFKVVYETAVTQMQETVKTEHGEVDGHTTLSCVWFDDSKVLTLHVGDSRVYQLNSKEVLWRTRDHSVVQMLLDEGDITEEEMGTHPDQNKLFKSISVLGEKLDKPSIKQYPPLETGESLLVCSDGFWEHLSQHELCKLTANLSQQRLEKYCLVSQKRASGKSDNITAVMYLKGKED